MRYFFAACVLGLGLGAALGLLLVTLGDAWESFDPNETTAFFRLPASALRALRSHAIDLVGTFATAHPDEDPALPSRFSRDRGNHTRCAAC
jgi:hypothetical protein